MLHDRCLYVDVVIKNEVSLATGGTEEGLVKHTANTDFELNPNRVTVAKRDGTLGSGGNGTVFSMALQI